MELHITRDGWDLESLCVVGQAEAYAKYFGFTPETRLYALERAAETRNVVLRLHHLEYALRTIPPKGKEWVQRCRATAEAYRQFADETLQQVKSGSPDTRVFNITDALGRITALTTRRGVLNSEEQRELARWIVRVAQDLRNVEWPEDDYNRPHRWPFEVLKHLTGIAAENVLPAEREVALRLVEEAYAFFSSEPLADTLATGVAEVEQALRQHFGEADTHRALVSRQHAALLQKAGFFASHGNHLGAQIMFRHARKLAGQHSQYFTNEERESLERREQESISAAVTSGTFKAFRFAVRLNQDELDRTRDTPETTIEALVTDGLALIPDYQAIRRDALTDREESPLASMFQSVAIDGTKVVREALTEEQRLLANIDSRLALHARLLGRMTVTTLIKGVGKLGLRADHALRPLLELPNRDAGQRILSQGIERALAEDYVSASHILVPCFEDALRSVLRFAGFHTVSFEVVDSDSGASRTDDLTLGALLRASHAGGRTVVEFLGENLWFYISATMASPGGLNIRNRFAHGLVRDADCNPEVVGMTIHLLFCLVALVRTLR